MSDNINIIEIFKNIPNNLATTKEMLIVAVVGILIVIIELGILAVLIQGISKIVRALESAVGGKKEESASHVPVEAPAAPAAPVAMPASSSGVELVGVDEPTAAVIMAIISNESGIPLEQLNFKSIKITEDK